MSFFRILTAAIAIGCSMVPSGGRADEAEYSRQELFSVLRGADATEELYALPSKFSFPDDARERSSFGIDISHHLTDSCKCKFDWSIISKQKVAFVYLKATQGASYVDPTLETHLSAIRELPAGTLDVGVFHFLNATDAPDEQADHFTRILKRSGSLQLPPSLDLEWHPGAMRSDCPSDAIIRIRRTDGTKIERCDLWGFVEASSIIARANVLLDAMKVITGQEPILYTSAAWWKARIGRDDRASELHTRLLWAADYSKGGLATEKPHAVSGHWDLWQFTDGARVLTPERIRVDASIFDGTRERMRRNLGVRTK